MLFFLQSSSARLLQHCLELAIVARFNFAFLYSGHRCCFLFLVEVIVLGSCNLGATTAFQCSLLLAAAWSMNERQPLYVISWFPVSFPWTKSTEFIYTLIKSMYEVCRAAYLRNDERMCSSAKDSFAEMRCRCHCCITYVPQWSSE